MILKGKRIERQMHKDAWFVESVTCHKNKRRKTIMFDLLKVPHVMKIRDGNKLLS